MPEYAFSLTRIFLNKVRIEDPVLFRENVTRCAIWYHLYNLKTLSFQRGHLVRACAL